MAGDRYRIFFMRIAVAFFILKEHVVVPPGTDCFPAVELRTGNIGVQGFQLLALISICARVARCEDHGARKIHFAVVAQRERGHFATGNSVAPISVRPNFVGKG